MARFSSQVIAPRGRKSAAGTLGRFRFAARRLRCRRRAWRRGNGPAKHLDSIAVSIKLTQSHYVCDGDILAFLIETVFAARIEACCSILGNDISQCGYSPLMSGDYDASAHFGVSISHTINMGEGSRTPRKMMRRGSEGSMPLLWFPTLGERP